MAKPIHPEATHHLPFFITPPGQTDILMNVMIVFLALMLSPSTWPTGLKKFSMKSLPS
jgi:hypothetical protein